jgi:hypothetical protein
MWTEHRGDNRAHAAFDDSLSIPAEDDDWDVVVADPGFGGATASTPDVIALAQEVSGKDLEAFFDAWLSTPEKPVAWSRRPAIRRRAVSDGERRSIGTLATWVVCRRCSSGLAGRHRSVASWTPSTIASSTTTS